MSGTFTLHPQNPRCFLYRGKAIVLIAATEHYGAVINGAFDYVTYLDELARNHLNLSRTFTFYRELEGSIAELGYANTLAPHLGREVMPWKCIGPGIARDGGLKFDLNQWNPDYFARFKDFLKEAEQRDIIVEVVLFCNPYDNEKQWAWFPCHKDNNINGVGDKITDCAQFMEKYDPVIFEFQKTFVRKMVKELNNFDNFYFEICNEAGSKRRDREFLNRRVAWQLALCDVIRQSEENMPKKHLIAVNAHEHIPAYQDDGKVYVEMGDGEYYDDPGVDIINIHYISRRIPGKGWAVCTQISRGAGITVGTTWAFMKSRRQLRKPIMYDENFAGVVRGNPVKWDRNRMEAWEMILAGGAGFDHLDWSIIPEDVTGSGKAPISDGRYLDGRQIREQLGALADLWLECGPAFMAPNDDLVVSSPQHCMPFSSSRKDGKLHVVYIADARRDDQGFGEPILGEVTLRLPKAKYRLRILNPVTVEWTERETVSLESEQTRIVLTDFQQDCVLVLSRIIK